MFPKKRDGPPKSSILIEFFHYKPSILGYPYIWKHPYPFISDIDSFKGLPQQEDGSIKFHDILQQIEAMADPQGASKGEGGVFVKKTHDANHAQWV